MRRPTAILSDAKPVASFQQNLGGSTHVYGSTRSATVPIHVEAPGRLAYELSTLDSTFINLIHLASV